MKVHTKNAIAILAFLLLACLPVTTLSAITVEQSQTPAVGTPIVLDTPTPTYAWIVCAEKLYVRAGSSMNNAAVRYLSQGTPVPISEWRGTWARIATNEWVNGRYLCRR